MSNYVRFSFRTLLSCSLLFVALLAFSSCARRQPEPVVEPPQMEASVPLEHVVKYRGETLGLIANWYTGRTANWPLILDANPGMTPERINIGDIILVPRELVVQDTPLPEQVVRRFLERASEVSGEKKEGGVTEDAAAESQTGEVATLTTGGAEPTADTADVEPVSGDKESDSAESVTADSEASTGTVVEPSTSGKASAGEGASEEAGAGAETEEAEADDLEREKLLEELLGQ